MILSRREILWWDHPAWIQKHESTNHQPFHQPPDKDKGQAVMFQPLAGPVRPSAQRHGRNFMAQVLKRRGFPVWTCRWHFYWHLWWNESKRNVSFSPQKTKPSVFLEKKHPQRCLVFGREWKWNHDELVSGIFFFEFRGLSVAKNFSNLNTHLQIHIIESYTVVFFFPCFCSLRWMIFA